MIQQKDGYYIGIDLGTTNSVVACTTDQTEVICGPDGEPIMRSAVAYLEGDYLCGNAAIGQIHETDMELVLSIKRLMGLKRDDERLERYVKRASAYALKAPDANPDQDIEIELGGHRKTPMELSAMILSRLRDNTERRLGGPIRGAVVTVPAYFTPAQKKATWSAARDAGLTVMRILDEPSAAAIAYGMHHINPGESKTIAVFDMGGGTFDISIISIVMDKFVTLALGGDAWLGGDDFDEVILNYVVDFVKENYQWDIDNTTLSDNPLSQRRFLSELKHACELAKISLSTDEECQIDLPDLPGLPRMVVSLTRKEFEERSNYLIEKAMTALNSTMKEAGITDQDLDYVLLVGGSTFIPSLKKIIETRFGPAKVLPNQEQPLDPMHCVAIGASLLANSLRGELFCPVCNTSYRLGDERCPECDYALTRLPEEVCTPTSHYYAAELQNEVYEVMIAKGEMLPTDPVRKRFFTNRHNQRRIRVPIFASETAQYIKGRINKQGDTFALLPEGLPAGTSVWVSLWLNEEEIFDVKIELEGAGLIETKITYSSKAVVYDQQMLRGEIQIENLKKQGRQSEADSLDRLRREADELFKNGEEKAALEAAETFANRSEEITVRLTTERKKARNNLNLGQFLLSNLPEYFTEANRQRINEAMNNVNQYLQNDSVAALTPANDHLKACLDEIMCNPVITQLLEVYSMVEMAVERDPGSATKLRNMWQGAKTMKEPEAMNELKRIRAMARNIIEQYGGLNPIGQSGCEAHDETEQLGVETDDRLRGYR